MEVSVWGIAVRAFREALAGTLAGTATGEPGVRTWVYVPYDQLTDRIGPLAELEPGDVGIVMVESPAKAARRPYHKQKLFLILASQRRFALEQAARGVDVRYVVSAPGEGYAEPLRRLAEELGPLVHMEPAERELRAELGPLVDKGQLIVRPHGGWLTTPEDFVAGTGAEPPWRMDRFYRAARRRTGILMDGKDFEGGKLSFDAENRLPWPGEPAAPAVPRFEHGEIEAEVEHLIESNFADHPGRLDPSAIPTCAEHARAVWDWAKVHCLEHFGPFEDAMARDEANLFHTRLSPLLHLHRLLPAEVVSEVAAMDAPIASREGFIRQILGWREFVRHVHRATDGFRLLPARPKVEPGVDPVGGASPSALGSSEPLPAAYWGKASGLDCLDVSVARVLDTGFGHHIERLMVLSNLATLLDVSPRELTDWFWVAYIDAFDWVVEPNVLGMGTYGVGDVMTTKPYISGAAYIDRMSDFCGGCAFKPKTTCPITRLYWAFLGRHGAALDGNHRIAMPLRSLQKRSEDKREGDQRVYEHLRGALSAGETVTPESVAEALRESP